MDCTPGPAPPFNSYFHSPKNKSRTTTVVVETGVEEAPLSRSPSNSKTEKRREERSHPDQKQNHHHQKREEEKKEKKRKRK